MKWLWLLRLLQREITVFFKPVNNPEWKNQLVFTFVMQIRHSPSWQKQMLLKTKLYKIRAAHVTLSINTFSTSQKCRIYSTATTLSMEAVLIQISTCYSVSQWMENKASDIPLPHSAHKYSRILSWTRICSFNMSFLANDLPHCSQAWLFTPWK